MNATEQSDLATLKQTLTAQITSELEKGCTTFGDGSYFCENPASGTPGIYTPAAPYFNVYAAKDAAGYQEIYMQDGSQISQLTQTNYDNVQPAWNKNGSLIVWQGLVDERWQIFLYDVETGATQELTSGDESSISPAIEGSNIAWQGWDAAGNNWEIYLAMPLDAGMDGTTQTATSSPARASGWNVREITHDSWAHVEPTLAGGLLAWQEYRSGTWQIFVDDLASGGISQVSEGSGTNSNPQFLLAWTNEADGTTTALAYDVTSGKVSPLAAPPAPAPISLPQSSSGKNNAALPAADGPSTSTATSTSAKSGGGSDSLD